MDQANWYGGRVQQIVRMEIVDNGNSFVLRLDKMQMGRSHRFARYMGSRRILQVKLPEENYTIKMENVKEWLEQKFVLCGRVFVPFATKEGKVFMMETNENYEREESLTDGDDLRLTLSAFVDWHNPIHLNHNQVSAFLLCSPGA